ncbi:cytochrome c [Cognatishimia sp.]|uniref:c-type cytochrome n=1 Tax=Cognatishimia sp. TaxID=2211648 RepID=UPI0035167EAD
MAKRLLTSLTLMATMAAGASFADGHIAGAIKARQGQMQLYAHYLGVLGGMARGNTEYNAEAAQAAADSLLAVASISGATLWPQGSDMDSVEGTRAKAAIWENFADVGAKSMAVTTAAANMATAAGTDLESLRAAMGDLGGTCGACHKAYRGR